MFPPRPTRARRGGLTRGLPLFLAIASGMGCGDRSPPALWPEPPPPTLARPIGVDIDAQRKPAEPTEPDEAEPDEPDEIEPDAAPVAVEPAPPAADAAPPAAAKSEGVAAPKSKRKPAE